ncbi:MAG: branched-chain amino acid transport system II carrier protein [Chlamydiales bacterium]
METTRSKSTIIATGLAMFSMFFGAGNVVFPLAVGQLTKDQNLFGIIGLLFTGVGVPFLGLVSMTLFNGNYKHFFERIGRVPGYIVALVIMGLIGPFGATPRLITVSYATLSLYSPGLSLIVFSLIACMIIFVFTFKKSKVLDILGYFLTPILLISLGIIIVKGVMTSSVLPISDLHSMEAFWLGLYEGYQTMDLPGALFFSSVVLACLEGDEPRKLHQKNVKHMIFMTLKASLIGASLLAITYIGFSYVAALHSAEILNISPDAILGALSVKIMGQYAAIVAIAAVSLACLTTAIALVVVFSEFLHYDVFQEKMGYLPSLLITIGVTFVISIQGFDGIAKFLVPAMIIIYPALIVLSIVNIAYKLFHFPYVKLPVAITFVISLGMYFF